MISFVNWFTKLTAWPLQWLCFRTKIYYKNKAVQGRRVKGPAIIVSNHTSVFDYAVLLFVFFLNTLRCQMAEVLFKKKVLGPYLRAMGGIYVDRGSHSFTFLTQSEAVLRRGGTVCVFPESRIPEKGETVPLEFKPSVIYLALNAGVSIIPVYVNGSYFSKKRARVIIGTPFNPEAYIKAELSEKQNLSLAAEALRGEIIKLKGDLDAATGKG